MSERMVGYVGKENMPVGAAWSGIVHWESAAYSRRALCDDRILTMTGDPDKLIQDRGNLVTELKICKRCQAKP